MMHGQKNIKLRVKLLVFRRIQDTPCYCFHEKYRSRLLFV